VKRTKLGKRACLGICMVLATAEGCTATAINNGFGATPLVNHGEGNLFTMRCAGPRVDEQIFNDLAVDGDSECRVVSCEDPPVRLMPAYLRLVKRRDGTDFVCAEHGVQQSGKRRLGWTDRGRKSHGYEFQHEASSDPMFATTRYENGRALLRCDSDLATRTDCPFFPRNGCPKIMFLPPGRGKHVFHAWQGEPRCSFYLTVGRCWSLMDRQHHNQSHHRNAGR